ncbi:MAG: InlB B-repeat-containing protein [Bacteroidales bacterium]|nr:InlB B-repeat-containing protein [Candidatus Physcocola equi]
MKKIIFLLASLVAIFTAIANNYMHVYLNNGSILDFDTDSILQVDVLKDSVTNSNYLLVVKNDSSALRIDKSDIQKITYDDTIYKEEPVTKKDSIWGLEVKVTSTEINYLYSNTNIKAEFYSNIKIEDVYKLWCTYDNAYAYQNLNSVDKKNQSKSECTRINDSICLIKFEWEMETYKNIVSSLEVKLLLKDGTESNELLKEVTYISEPEVFVVSFYTQDSILIESQKVEKGKSATAVDAPVVDGYEFIGWSDSSFINVMKDLDIYAQYKAITKDTLPVSGQIAGHDYVDLGLPSGILWATCNVGATTPEEYGDYFAWGETEPKEVYSDNPYKWNKDTGEKDKWGNTIYEYIYGSDNLDAEDDAATANWGSAWRMPTTAELAELINSCDWNWAEDYNGSGVNGKLGTSKVNGNTIFLPAIGFRNDTILYDGSNGLYWSSMLKVNEPDLAHCLYFNSGNIFWNQIGVGAGLPVRAVANKTTDIEEYVVSFYTQDSVLIESQKVEKGKSATAVDAPVVDGYEFIGWSDSSFTNVMKDLDIYAQYKAITKDTLPVSGQIAEHDYVDLGLPSGTLWATYNVGATMPTEYGDYFAWGETNIKKVPSFWKDYKFCDDDLNITKYSMAEDGDSLVTLLPEDDAATANWGNSWRMPTWYEFQELIDGCSWTYKTNVNGISVKGYLGVSKTNNSAIFIPEAGCDYNAAEFEEALYWTSSLIGEGPFLLNSLIPKYAVFADFRYRQNVGCDVNLYDWDVYRTFGLSVRAVANK